MPDLTTLGPIVLTALAALGFIGQYFRRQARADRVENRKLRRLVLAYDQHLFRVERDIARLGRYPRRRPAILLEAEQHEDEEPAEDPAGDEAGYPPGPDPAPPGPDPGVRARHRAGR